MDRRSFLRASTVGGAVAAASTLAAPAIAQERITWRMVTTWPRNFPGLGVGAQRLADRITAASGGRLYLYALAAAGQDGVERALGIMQDEIVRTMKLMGVKRVDQFTHDRLRLR